MNNRGKFRSMDIDELQQSASLSLFDDTETVGIYSYPLHDNALTSSKLWTDIDDKEVYHIGKFTCAKSPQSHIGPFRWAIDFLVLDGASVLVMEEGTVVEVVEDSDSWGDGPEFRDKLNYVTVQHFNGEFSQYCHLEKGSVGNNGIKNGTIVRKGQQIAIVGKTGWTDRDHLHVIVYRGDSSSENPFGFKSFRIRFQ